jgi:hypothetical protein
LPATTGGGASDLTTGVGIVACAGTCEGAASNVSESTDSGAGISEAVGDEAAGACMAAGALGLLAMFAQLILAGTAAALGEACREAAGCCCASPSVPW